MSRLLTRARLASLLGTFVIATAVILVPASPALAAGCNLSSCTGHDPEAYGCSPSAYTLDEFTELGARVELRYSPACGAAWTRVTSSTHNNTRWAQIRTNGNTVYGVQITVGQNWTKMINFQHLVRSCTAYGAATAAPTTCTGYH